MGKTINAELLSMGSGKAFFNRNTAAGVATQERFVGDAAELKVTTTDEVVEKKTMTTAERGLMASVLKSRVMEIAITLSEWSPENLSMSLMGEVGTLGQAIATSQTAAFTAVQGAYLAMPHRKITVTSVAPTAGGDPYVVDEDYEVDSQTGRIYIIEGGGIADDTAITVTYSAAADDAPIINGGTVPKIEGFLRFIPDNASGDNREFQAWKVSFRPDGEVPFITEEFGNLVLKGKILDDSANHGTGCPYYRLIDRDAEAA